MKVESRNKNCFVTFGEGSGSEVSSSLFALASTSISTSNSCRGAAVRVFNRADDGLAKVPVLYS
jgi:hypothetical protein